MPLPVVQTILEANRRYDAEFGRGLSNHLSMAVIALHELGAPDAKITTFFERYRRRLEPAPEGRDPITRDTFGGHLGDPARAGDYLAFFRNEVAHAGADAAVRTYLPELMPGVAGGAFHPLIRLAYAVHVRDDADVAVSLAYFAVAFLHLGAPAPSGSDRGAPLDLLEAIAREPALAGRRQATGPIFARLHTIGALPEFARVSADALATRDVTPASLADAAAALHATDPDLTTLHTVTAAHALRVLSPRLDDTLAASRAVLQAFAAVYVAQGAPPLQRDAPCERVDGGPLPSWEAIAAAAIGSSDEHVIKLVYTSREEAAVYGQPRYQRFAGEEAGLV